jgi:Calcineurin-like phosphoesterase superfamily domain
MRMGLLADIHEDVQGLAAAIERCRREGVDRLLTLGDIFETGERFARAVDLLREADVDGVWGNHEFGLYAGRGDSVENLFDWRTLDYMHRLRSRVEVEGVLLSHVLPCIDPTDVSQPWYVERAPLTADAAAPSFSAYPNRRMFVGHFHQWLAVTPNGPLPWSGDQPIPFRTEERYLVVVAAVCDGWCAIYDTESDVFTPCDLRSARSDRKKRETDTDSSTNRPKKSRHWRVGGRVCGRKASRAV